MLASLLPPFYLGTYSLSTSSLGCNALCIVISFLVLWLNCLSFFLLHFKNGPKDLTKRTAEVFIPSKRFLRHSFVSSSFLVLLRYSILIFFHPHLFDGVSFQFSQVSVGFLFSKRFNFLLIR